MKPLKITMTAFGPYKNKEVIDFTELKENRLFVVSGKTGAGKTTIFDAICFALYGTASGEDRNDTKFMRSDFADDDIHTAVELEFELHQHHYRIKRQLPHVKKGNKSATGEQYEFYENINGREIPCVDRQIVSEINKKVESLIGLSKEQFSQIVMLPQGEFRKLLTSETVNKEEILRKIFKTEPYLWITERLKERKKAAEDDFKDIAQTRNRYILDIHSAIPSRAESILFAFLSQENFNTNQIVAGLEEEADFYKKEIETNKKQSEKAENGYSQKLEEFHKAESLNEKFHNLDEKKSKLFELSRQVPLFAAKEEQLEKAERASKIELYEIQVNDWRRDEKEKQHLLAVAAEKQKEAAEQLEKCQQIYDIEENKKSMRDEVNRKLEHCHDYLPIVMEIDNKKSELVKTQKKVQSLAKELESRRVQINAEKNLKEKLTADIKGMEQEVDQLPEKQQRLAEMRERVRVFQEYLKFNKQTIELEKLKTEKEIGYQEIKKQYEELEVAWVNGQASILAAHLHDGKPCPVCGSIEHPNKAKGQNAVPSKAELEKVKYELNEKDHDYHKTVILHKNNLEQLDKIAAEITEMGIAIQEVQPAFNQLVAKGQDLKKEVDSLLKEKETLLKLKKDLEKIEFNLMQAEREMDEKVTVHQEQNTVFETKKAVYQEQISRIPEEIRTLAALEKKIADISTEKNKLEQSWDNAQKWLQSAKTEDTKAAANLNNANKQLDESKRKKERAEKQFAELLVNGNFTSEEAYIEAKMSEHDRGQLKESINHFQNELALTKQHVQELQESLKDKIRPDVAALAAETEHLKMIAEAAEEQLRQSKDYLVKTQDLSSKILTAEKKVQELEKQFSIITDLFDVVRGQNTSKISFERYLQIEFLEQIIVAANERLKHLSNGQFLLMRSERQESRGKQSGLGLDVYDAYTGQTRDVKTLSGGEKFNASLCLALGMADVIQSYQGGVSIDTMFIDEGFGSLDEESLNKAIDTLIDLQKSGRMIGVISHVQELKDSIPAILEVEKTKEGYSKTKFVLK